MASITLPHLLVIDDDNRLRTLLTRFLSGKGFLVSGASDADEARALLALFAFDLLIVDVMMPGEDGIALAGYVQQHYSTPMLMLSALNESEHRIDGLRAGVDDYVAKPFEPEELLLRIHAIRKRYTTHYDHTSRKRIMFDRFIYDPAEGSLQADNQPCHLTTSEQAILHALAEHVGHAVSREMLASMTSDVSRENTRAIDVLINRLRKKIEPDEKKPRIIQTVRGAGYMLQGKESYD